MADTVQASGGHVPLIFLGRSFRRGTYEDRVHAVDVAPTLAQALGLTPAERLDGQALVEALEER
jgi:arylsulfatase A-like enzyme